MRYPALIDGRKGAYGVAFPDLDGVVAMGATIDEALLNAEEALRDYVLEMEADGLAIAEPTPPEAVIVPEGSSLVLVPLIRLTGRTVRANLTLDEGVAAFIDEEAKRRNMTRVSFIEWMARRVAADGV